MVAPFAVPLRRFVGSSGLAVVLALGLASTAATAGAQTQQQWCFFVDAPTERGPRFISDVFCIFGAPDNRDVMNSFGIWYSSRYSDQQRAEWGRVRVGGQASRDRNRASAARNNVIARYRGANLVATTGWSYYPGAAQLAQGLSELSDAMDRVLVDNGIGVSMAMAHGESNALAFGASVRFGGRWRFHVHNPIEALSLGEVTGPSEGRDATYRQGWGLEILRSLTPGIAIGVGAHNVSVRVERQDSFGNVSQISEKTTWDPTVSFTLPLGALPIYFRYGQQSRYSIGMIVDFERAP